MLKELSKEDKKIFERKFLSKKKGSKKKTTPKAKEVVSELDKRIKAFKRLLEFKPKDKKLAMRVKALERLREFKQ